MDQNRDLEGTGEREDRAAKARKLARDVLTISRNTLLVNLRFMDMALSQFEMVEDPRWPLATDGEHIFYQPVELLRRYKKERQGPVRDMLHMVFHCIFHHSFRLELVDRDCWDLAADLAVESVINDLGLACTSTERQRNQTALLEQFRGEVRQMTAERIYRLLLDSNLTPAKLQELRRLVQADSHDPWYPEPGGEGSGEGPGEGPGLSEGDLEDGGDSDRPSRESMARMAERWKGIAERMQVDLETWSKQRGDTAGSMLQNLKAVTREKYDYSAFLRKFAVMGEVMKVNDDEFDQIFYTYGLNLYHNMPLVEPLEYKEVKRVREFVIAIDTSGSVQGKLVQKFLQKTYNILKQEESYFRRINIHIIQCDADIQEDARITSQEEFDRYLQSMKFHGFGGTDFRPVFTYVEQLQKQGEFTNLKGLIYFTDGYGLFPQQKPPYPTAFVFVDDEDQDTEIPPWAIRLVLHSDEV